MLRHLFPRLTPAHDRGRALFDALVGEARAEHWFVEGALPDTLDGRFAILTTVIALATVRLERGDASAHAAAVALAERFVEAMDAEHRQLGIGEPGIGKTVRRLVGALARRVELWRSAIDGGDWQAAAIASLFPGRRPPLRPPRPRSTISPRPLRDFWTRLESSPAAAIAEGRIG